MTDLMEKKEESEPRENKEKNNDFSSEKIPKILLGAQLHLQVIREIGLHPEKLQTEVVGVEQDNYIIVKSKAFSLLGNFQNIFFQGTTLITRCICEGTAFGFETSILKVIYNPTLVFIKYPKSLEYLNIRANQRVRCLLPAKVSVEGNDYEVFIIDISKSGCRFTAIPSNKVNSLSLEINQEIRTSAQFPSVEGCLSMPGRLKQVKKNNNRIDYGIAFDTIEDGTKNKLFKYLSSVEEIQYYL